MARSRRRLEQEEQEARRLALQVARAREPVTRRLEETGRPRRRIKSFRESVAELQVDMLDEGESRWGIDAQRGWS